MNERIQELAFKANKDLDGNVPIGFAEKFAELLIGECAMLVEGFILEQEVALDEYQEYEASAVLKEHFGVEE